MHANATASTRRDSDQSPNTQSPLTPPAGPPRSERDPTTPPPTQTRRARRLVLDALEEPGEEREGHDQQEQLAVPLPRGILRQGAQHNL